MKRTHCMCVSMSASFNCFEVQYIFIRTAVDVGVLQGFLIHVSTVGETNISKVGVLHTRQLKDVNIGFVPH